MAAPSAMEGDFMRSTDFVRLLMLALLSLSLACDAGPGAGAGGAVGIPEGLTKSFAVSGDSIN